MSPSSLYPCSKCHKPILWVLDFWLDPCTGQISHRACINSSEHFHWVDTHTRRAKLEKASRATAKARSFGEVMGANTTQTGRIKASLPNQDRVRSSARSRHQTRQAPVVTVVGLSEVERKLTAAKATLSRARAPRGLDGGG